MHRLLSCFSFLKRFWKFSEGVWKSFEGLLKVFGRFFESLCKLLKVFWSFLEEKYEKPNVFIGFREITFLAAFLVQKLIFGHFWNCKKWNLVKIKFREIDLFDFTSFFGLDFFKFSGPLREYRNIKTELRNWSY